MASSKAIANSTLVLRIFTLLLLAASVVVMATNVFSNGDGQKIRFTELHTYRFVLAVGIVGFVYTLAQIPFAIYLVATEKRWIRNGCLPVFDFYGDKLVSFLLATAAGAGFAVTYEYKRLLGDLIRLDQVSKFLDKGYISAALLFLGFICMAILSILSSITRTTTTRGGFFG